MNPKTKKSIKSRGRGRPPLPESVESVRANVPEHVLEKCTEAAAECGGMSVPNFMGQVIARHWAQTFASLRIPNGKPDPRLV